MPRGDQVGRKPAGEKLVAGNRRAMHDYHIEETYEAGVALTGTEIQSVRRGQVSLRDSFARIEDGQVILYDANISPWEFGNRFNHDPKRPRKLLMHKSEIRRLLGKTQEQGYTLVPLKMYLKGQWAKVELALAKGKKLYDKREDIADRERKMEARRALKEKQWD